MPDYRRMYCVLCSDISDVLDDMRAGGEFQGAYQRLEMLLHEAEDIYIETADVIHLEDRLPKDKTKKE